MEALKSETWNSVSENVVMQVLQLDQLRARECELVAALLRWGQAQDDKHLRQKIDASLKLIRWAQMEEKEFEELCLGKLTTLLTAEEKSQISESISTNMKFRDEVEYFQRLDIPMQRTVRRGRHVSLVPCKVKKDKEPATRRSFSLGSVMDFFKAVKVANWMKHQPLLFQNEQVLLAMSALSIEDEERLIKF